MRFSGKGRRPLDAAAAAAAAAAALHLLQPATQRYGPTTVLSGVAGPTRLCVWLQVGREEPNLLNFPSQLGESLTLTLTLPQARLLLRELNVALKTAGVDDTVIMGADWMSHG